MINTSEVLYEIEPAVREWIRTAILALTAPEAISGLYAPSPHELSGEHHAGTLSNDQAPQFVLLDGTRELTGDLPVASGVTIDGVDLSAFKLLFDAHDAADAVTAHGSVGAHTHQSAGQGGQLDHGLALTGLGDDDHAQYAGADGGSVTRSAYQAERLNKQVIAGAGLTGGGTLTADRTLDVGAGAGIAVAANSVAVDVGATFAWTGAHSWVQTMTTAHIIPGASDTYDIGSTTRLIRKIYASEFDAVIFAANTVSLIGGWLRIANSGSLGADLTAAATTANVGQAITPGAWIELRAIGQVEYILIGSLVSGTTYNVTRNVDGSGANDWPAGAPYTIRTNGVGLIDLNASGTPRIQLTRQGAAYNTQTEMLRIGDLNANWGYVAESYGLALGEYAAGLSNLTWDATNGLRLRTHSTTVLQLDNSGGASIAGVLNIGASGGIYQGSGTFASPTTGLKLYSSGGVGILAGYLSGVLQARFNGSGEIEAGAGAVKLNSSGLRFDGTGGRNSAGAAEWYKSAVRYLSMGLQVDLGSVTAGYIESARQLDIAVTDAGASISLTPGTGGEVAAGGALRVGSTYPLRMGGTSFPSSPVNNDLFYRSDYDLLFFYNGTYWLTVNEYPLTMPYPRVLQPVAAAGVVADGLLEQRSGLTAYVTDLWARSNAQTTNNGSNYHTVTINALTAAAAATVIATFNTSADAVGTNIKKTFTPNLLLTSSDLTTNINTSRTGSPGNLFVTVEGRYRLRAT